MKARKEITVAVIIGLALALLITGGILRAGTALRSLKVPSSPSALTNQSTSPSENNTQQLFLNLDTPDNSVTDSAAITVNGKTLPGTYIAIVGEKGDYLIVPNDLGTFSQEVALIKGANTIRITVYQEDGTKVDQTLSAVYSTAEL